MNFPACDGNWTVGPGGESICVGSLQTFTGEEMQALNGSALTWDDVQKLQGDVVTLFAVAFAFVVLRKLL